MALTARRRSVLEQPCSDRTGDDLLSHLGGDLVQLGALLHSRAGVGIRNCREGLKQQRRSVCRVDCFGSASLSNTALAGPEVKGEQPLNEVRAVKAGSFTEDVHDTSSPIDLGPHACLIQGLSFVWHIYHRCWISPCYLRGKGQQSRHSIPSALSECDRTGAGGARHEQPVLSLASSEPEKAALPQPNVPGWRISLGNLAAGATAGCAVEAGTPPPPPPPPPPLFPRHSQQPDSNGECLPLRSNLGLHPTQHMFSLSPAFHVASRSSLKARQATPHNIIEHTRCSTGCWWGLGKQREDVHMSLAKMLSNVQPS